MLSAKLFENRIIFIQSEDLEYHKTQVLHQIVKPYGIDKLCFLTGTERMNNNFELAAGKIKNVVMKRPQQFHVPDLLKNDYIFITKQGLIDLEEIIESRHANYFRNRRVPTQAILDRKARSKLDNYDIEIIKPILESDKITDYDDDLPLHLQSESLKTYVDDLRKLQLDADQNKKEATE